MKILATKQSDKGMEKELHLLGEEMFVCIDGINNTLVIIFAESKK